MSKQRTLKRYKVDDMFIHYVIDEEGHVEWLIYPITTEAKVQIPKKQIQTFSLIQAKIREDKYDKNFSNGITMFNSETSQNLIFINQVIDEYNEKISIVTIMQDRTGNQYRHVVNWEKNTHRLKTWVEFINKSRWTVQLDWLAGFCLAGISPYHEYQPIGQINLIRFRSKWAMEGRVEERPVEEYNLEPSWKPSGLAIEQFGQNGTMPVRNFFPIVGYEDRTYNVIWLAELEGKASWQLNAARLDDRLIMYGGLPDHDNGQWQVAVASGTVYQTPPVYLTVGIGTLFSVSKRLQMPTVYDSKSLPIIYNEWATTWGHPNQKLIEASLKVLGQHLFDYYVIDAGWYQSQSNNWEIGHGDWLVDSCRFPQGLAMTVKKIHSHKMKAGIWYEFETVGKESEIFLDTQKLIKRDGVIVTTMKRRFLNLLNPQVKEYLQERLATNIKDSGFDYLKVDYNDNVGVGMDWNHQRGAEPLQALTEESLNWFDRIHNANPGIVIESCSSGGHRLTPAYIEASDLSSSSDAHETPSIPIIAMNELNIIPAAKNLIWCVVHSDDKLSELTFHLVSTMLGCINFSGDVLHLNSQQWKLIDQAFKFHHQVDALIAQGTPFGNASNVKSYQFPKGYQICGFTDHEEIVNSCWALELLFSFDQMKDIVIADPFLDSGWHKVDEFGSTELIRTVNATINMQAASGQYLAKAILLVHN